MVDTLATSEQLADLKSLCDEIEQTDNFIEQIKEQTHNYTCVTAATCKTLNGVLSDLLLNTQLVYGVIEYLAAHQA